MEFEWDRIKAEGNLGKHGVSFEEASSAFADLSGLDGPDLAHSRLETRRLRLARSLNGRLLIVAYTKRSRNHEEVIRIISARIASRRERRRYEARED